MKLIFSHGALALFAMMFFSACGTGPPNNRAAENAASVGVLRAVNGERSKRGLQPLTYDPGLQRSAAGHADFLQRNVRPQAGKPTKAMAHQGFAGRARRARAEGYQVLSEVVMIGYAGDLSAVPQRTIAGWLRSPGHRKAILHPDRRIMGIETRLPADGRYFVVGLLSNGRAR